jgi:hypothetical protein
MQQDAAEAAALGIDAFLVQYVDPIYNSMLTNIFQGAIDPATGTTCKIKVAIMFAFANIGNGPNASYPMQYYYDTATSVYKNYSIPALNTIYNQWSVHPW